MDFQPLYLKDRIKQVDSSDSQFQADKLNVINPRGSAGIVTLWAKPSIIWDKLRENSPELFTPDSPLVALSSLYGNGLPQMLANLAHNPQIQYLAVTGNDTLVVPSSKYLSDFLNGDITLIDNGGVKMWRVGKSQFSLDSQLNPDMFKHLKVKRFAPTDLEGIVNFVSQQPLPAREDERVAVKLIEPEFRDFPSDRTFHNITANTPLDAWIDLIYHIDRFGINIKLEKGVRRALFNVDVNIKDASFEPEDRLRTFGFDPQNLKDYRAQILGSQIPENMSYTYGHRLRTHWGGDTLAKIGSMLKEDPSNRHCFVSLWDTREDLLAGKSSPCFTDAYFINSNGDLMMTAGFRTHNAVEAYLMNIYGLRAIQENVAHRAGLNPGQLNLRSRWVGIDPENTGTVSALQLVNNHRKTPINVHDLRGYFVVGAGEKRIVAEHYSPNGDLLRRYEGPTAADVKDKIRHDRAISDPDHAVWLGYELGKAHFAVHGNIPEL